MKNVRASIRLDPQLLRELDDLSRRLGRSRSDLVRDALRRQIALLRFKQIRRDLMPSAAERGILRDEDVFDVIS